MTQEEALAILKTGANVFLTGEPGSGKTHTVNQYVAYLRSCGVEPAITASTGIAATHIGGFTIHAWSGIGIRRDLGKYDLDRIGQNKNVVRRVGNARILIIDEVSMLSADVLSMVDAVCREVRRSHEPFGGLQVVLVGDFFQLPPVSRRNEEENKQATLTGNAENAQSGQFAYRSGAWGSLRPVTCYLSEQHRQDDAAFLELLSAIRRRRFEERHRELLRTRYSPEPKDEVTRLYSHNADVDRINDARLAKLGAEERVFEMESRGPERLISALKRGCLSPEVLALKVGARVMFTKNDNVRHRYVNGTLGTVTGFSKENGVPCVKTESGTVVFADPDEWRIEDGGRVIARLSQVPLRLAWAITVHKSQGMSLDAAHMDLSGTFEYGQGYVALSRVKTLRGLSLAGLNARALEVHPEVCARDEEFRAESLRAKRRFAAFEPKELGDLHANFIRACGGSPDGHAAKAPRGRAERRKASPKRPTHEITYDLLKDGRSFDEIAHERGMVPGTIISHVEKLVSEGKIDPERDLVHMERPERFGEIKEALETVYKKEGRMLLSPTRARLGKSCTYEEVRFVRLFLG